MTSTKAAQGFNAIRYEANRPVIVGEFCMHPDFERQAMCAVDELRFELPRFREYSKKELLDELTLSLRGVVSNYDGSSYLVVPPVQTDQRVTIGQLLAYCQAYFGSIKVYGLGTRCRPLNLDGKGGIMIKGGSIVIEGDPWFCQMCMPLVSAILRGIAPHHLWGLRDQLGHPWCQIMECTPYDTRSESDFDFQDTHKEDSSEDERHLWLAIAYVRWKYSSSGSSQALQLKSIGSVSFSKEQFKDYLFTWWPYARLSDDWSYQPTGMHEGGIRWISGMEFRISGSYYWLLVLVPMFASLICGIPVRVAALLPSAEPFWSKITGTGIREKTARQKRLLSL